MSDAPPPAPLPSTRQLRLETLAAAGRMVGAGIVILGTYALIPLEWFDGRWSPAVLLLIGLTIYGIVVTRRMIRLTKAPNPMLRLGESLIVVVVVLVVVFAFTYVVMSRNTPNSFNVGLDKNSALYFSMTITATTGFGDIVANSVPARNFVSVQMFINLVVLALAIRGVTTAAQFGRKRLAAASSDGSAAGTTAVAAAPAGEAQGEQNLNDN